jgi:hypothetical protein
MGPGERSEGERNRVTHRQLTRKAIRPCSRMAFSALRNTRAAERIGFTAPQIPTYAHNKGPRSPAGANLTHTRGGVPIKRRPLPPAKRTYEPQTKRRPKQDSNRRIRARAT